MGLNCCERERAGEPNERTERRMDKGRGKTGGEQQTFWAAVTSALRSEWLAASPKKVPPAAVARHVACKHNRGERERHRGRAIEIRITWHPWYL